MDRPTAGFLVRGEAIDAAWRDAGATQLVHEALHSCGIGHRVR
jgi:hypothetical protein